MLDLAGETCLTYHKIVSFYHVDKAKENILEDFSLEEGLSSASTVTIGQPNLIDKKCTDFPFTVRVSTYFYRSTMDNNWSNSFDNQPGKVRVFLFKHFSL